MTCITIENDRVTTTQSLESFAIMVREYRRLGGEQAEWAEAGLKQLPVHIVDRIEKHIKSTEGPGDIKDIKPGG